MANEANRSAEDSFGETKRGFLDECVVCGECLENCPVFPSMEFAHFGSTELIESILKVLEG